MVVKRFFITSIDKKFLESMFLFFLLWISTHKCSSQKVFSAHYLAKPQSMRCIDLDPDFSKFTTCSLRPVNRTLKLINIYVEIYKLPIYDARAYFSILKKANGGFKPFGINVVLDGCKYLDGKKNIIFDWFFQQVVNYSNIDHPCPIESDIYVKDYPYQNVYTPSVFPVGDYRIEIKVDTNGKPRVKYQLYVTVEER